ncbi:Phospholipase/Carboxylesterase [Flavobacteriaceae bacterium MAR_2010_188]|nr:Phospholipase/Carboxylesterase [Flavobacteriaceae bacterium MAR_2010_188]
MNSTKKEISYTTTNSYSTLNKLSNRTKTIWFVCHGMGQLSERFIEHFSILDEVENYIIAPQAPSKYYHTQEYKTVGASWLTKLNTKKDTENVLRYFDSIFENEHIPKDISINFLGYSQGVSVVMRYIASRKIQFTQLILFAGGIPVELKPENFTHLRMGFKVTYIYGDEDTYLNNPRIASEMKKLESLLPDAHKIARFSGNHTFNLEEAIKNI